MDVSISHSSRRCEVARRLGETGRTRLAPAWCVTIQAWKSDARLMAIPKSNRILPSAMLCGVFYPMDALPEVVRWFSQVLPLAHATQLIRPLLFGEWPAHALWHVLALLAYAAAGFWIALRLFRRRLLK